MLIACAELTSKQLFYTLCLMLVPSKHLFYTLCLMLVPLIQAVRAS